MEVQCPKCDYEWETNSQLLFITCPNCQLKSRREDVQLNPLQEDEIKEGDEEWTGWGSGYQRRGEE